MAQRRPLLGMNLLADTFPPLHGVRVLAITCVLQVHLTITLGWFGLLKAPAFSAFSTSLWFGIDSFFVLSGFLIGTILLPDAQGRDRKGGVLRFWARRAFRILPNYYVVLTGLWMLAPGNFQRAGLPYEFAYLTNYHAFAIPPVMPWAWSLCVEEHFYLAVPLLAAVLAWIPRTGGRMAALFGLWVLGFALRLGAYLLHQGPWTGDELSRTIYVTTHTRIDTLVAGVLLAYVQRYYGARLAVALQRPAVKLGLLSITALAAGILLGPLANRRDFTGVFAWGTLTSILYFPLLLVLLNGGGAVSRWMGTPTLRRLATLGYGVYLVHPPLIVHVAVPAARQMIRVWHWPQWAAWPLSLASLLLATTAVAYMLHQLVEKPALWVRDRLAA